MKRSSIFCMLLSSFLLLGGCARQNTEISESDYIGWEKAQDAALDAAGLSETEVASVSTDLTAEGAREYYTVAFATDSQSYEYHVDALDGSILSTKKENTSGMSSTDSAKNTENPPETDAEQPANQQNAAPKASDAADASTLITAEQAQSAALAHAGLSADQITLIKNEPDYEHGRQIYEVEFYTADRKEYDYEIDASTGEVLQYDYDAEHASPSAAADAGSSITEEDAKALALAKVPGATAEHLWKFETDYDDGRLEYEGEIIFNGMEYDFEIDASTGEFLKWEAEKAD